MIKQFYTTQLPTFLTLIRWKNMVLLVLTLEVLFLRWGEEGLFDANFHLYVFVGVLVAGAGNVINDYYDQEIDKINKPERLIVGKIFTSKQTVWIYLVMNTLAISLSQNWILLLVFSFSILMFWLYSYRFKKVFILGNLTVAFLSFYAIYSAILFLGKGNSSIIFAGIAFVIQFLREIVKDLEDVEGDKKENCRTFAIVLGQQKTKLLLYIIITVFVAVLMYWQFTLFKHIWSFYVLYYLSAVFVVKVYRASHKTHFSFLSSLLKMMMLVGLSSVIFV